jgi:hypothetical protein
MFTIMAGKSTTPFSPLNPSQLLGYNDGSVNVIGMGYGEYYAGRFVQLRGTFNFSKNARLAIALVDPNAAYIGQTAAAQTVGTNNTTIPRIDVGVPLYFGPVQLYPSIAYQHQSYDNAKIGTVPIDNNVTSYIGSLGVKLGFGPFAVEAEGNWGKNFANLRGGFGASPSGAWKPNGAQPITAATVADDNKINDAETYSWWLDLSYKFGPVTPHLIYGQQKSKSILGPNTVGLSRNLKTEAKTSMIGFSIPIALAKGFQIRPEFMWYDDGDGDIETQGSKDFGKYSVYGVQFQITF